MLAPSHVKIATKLGFIADKNNLLIGVTATPDRADSHGLGDIFEKVIFSRSISTTIETDYLSPIHGRKILTNASLKEFKFKTTPIMLKKNLNFIIYVQIMDSNQIN